MVLGIVLFGVAMKRKPGDGVWVGRILGAVGMALAILGSRMILRSFK